MKPIRIHAHSVGLVFRNGHFIKVMEEGFHWVWLLDQVRIYDKTKDFVAPCNPNILLEDEAFKHLVEIVELQDNEIALHYRDHNYHQMLGSGKHLFWKSVVTHQFKVIDLDNIEVAEEIDRHVLELDGELANYCTSFIIESFEKGLLFVNGECDRQLIPGQYFFWNSRKEVTIRKADMRQQQVEISGQEVLTKDRAAIRVNFYLQYKIDDIKKAMIETKEYDRQLYILTQLALREYLGTLTLDELLANRTAVGDFMIQHLPSVLTTIGCQLIHAGIRDIILPGDIKDIMNRVLIAEKQAQANIITRRQEAAATRSLMNTAKMMEDNQMLFKLKEMEYVEKIAEKINSISLSGSSQIVDQLRDIFSK